MIEHDAANLIWKNWLRFADARRLDPDLSRELAKAMGRQIEDFTDFMQYITAGQLLVLANGNSGDPTHGHSCFYLNFSRYHLTCHDTRFVIMNSLQNVSRHSFLVEGTVSNSHILCHDVDMENSDFYGKISHLIDKGVIFTLDQRFSKYFPLAFQQEQERFRLGPFGYGLHYNCNTLVVSVLKRMLRTAF